jgi:hypothetical protein
MFARLSWCWFALVLALSLAFVGACAFARARAFDRVSAVTTGPEPVGGAAAGRNRIVPSTAFDSLFWISYAQNMAATGEWRLRATRIDNAPLGREVHWSSGFAWWLVALGEARRAFTGEPLPQAIEFAAAYANPALMMLMLVALGWLAAWRYGPAVGGLAVATAATLPHVIDGFAVNEPDHHGLINAAALGTVLCLIAGGFGWERRTAGAPGGLLPVAGRARRWFIASAWCGAAGLWLSAASQILVFAGVALGAVVAIFVAGAPDEHTEARPELWRTWGRWGAGAALAFYALEYFPSHLAMRLEVNHPLHAAAWWGAGELLAALAAWRQAGAPLWPRETQTRAMRAAAAFALASPLLAIAVGGAAWFRVLDPLSRVLPSLVIEGETIAANVQRVGAAVLWRDVGGVILLLAIGLGAVLARGLSRAERGVGLAAWCATIPALAMTYHQNRWLLVVGGLCPLFAITGAVAWRPALPRWARVVAIVGLAAVLARTFAWGYAGSSYAIATADRLGLAPDDVFVVALRHYAQELRRRAGPEPEPVVLAGPNESVLLAYYGGFRTVGTLYWENFDGLRAAAAIYAEPDLAEVKKKFAARGIRYLVSCPPGNFATGYVTLAAGAPDRARAEKSFAALLFAAEQFPQWLRPVWLPPPGPIADAPAARCYEFVPDQTEAEQLQHIERYRREAAATPPAPR